MKLNIAMVQMEIFDGKKDENLTTILNLLNKISKFEILPHIVVFPELFTTGYDLRNVEKYAEKIPGKTIDTIAEISKGKFIVIGTILESDGGHYFNTAFILGKSGMILGKYRKIHLFAPMLETQYLTPGNQINPFNISELEGLKIGIVICYDLRFPEIFRMLALNGAQIIFVPSEFPSPKRDVWKTLLHARAIENQTFVIGVNRTGKGISDDFFGYSLVSNGDYIEVLSEGPTIKTFTIDLNSLESIRKKMPVLRDRKKELYKL
jgi:predicted amidohydrolase